MRTVSPETTYRRFHASELSSSGPSTDAAQQLRLLQLESLWKTDADAALAVLDSFAVASQEPRILATSAELALARAEAKRDASAAAGYFLVAADRAYLYLRRIPTMPSEELYSIRFTRTREIYNRAVARFVQLRCSGGSCPDAEIEVAVLGERFVVHQEDSARTVPPSEVDRLRPAMVIDVVGFRNRYVRSGLGAALVASRANDGRDPLDSLLPPEGVVRAVTGLARFRPCTTADGDAARCVDVSFYDARRFGAARIDAIWFPLEADFTVPYGLLLARVDLLRMGIEGLFDPAAERAHRGVFLMETYDPNKIPILLVHGLSSSPLVWMEVTNELAGDPELRDSYQVWHYMYPTGLPFLYSAMSFRADLDSARRALDPELDDPAMQSLVLIGHSMGGLLARAVSTDSGDVLWNTVFSVPPSALVASPEDVATMRSVLELTALPYVGRVIFVATPHRGSAVADGLLGRLFSGLVSLPQDYRELFVRIARDNRDAIRPAMRELLSDGGPTSIRALSPRNPLLQSFASLPIAPGIPYHSIVGDRGRSRGRRSDGVVAYESAHLEGASSEAIFPADHGAASDPYAIAEMRRILREHLAASGGARAATSLP